MKMEGNCNESTRCYAEGISTESEASQTKLTFSKRTLLWLAWLFNLPLTSRQAPELIMAVLDKACDSTGCAAVHFSVFQRLCPGVPRHWSSTEHLGNFHDNPSCADP